MKRKGVFTLMLSLGVSAALLFALVPGAGAATGSDSVACVFHGTTDSLDPIDDPLTDNGKSDYDDDGTDDPGPQVASPYFAPIPSLHTVPVLGTLLDNEQGDRGRFDNNDYHFETDTASPFDTQCLHLDGDGATSGVFSPDTDTSDQTDVYEAWIDASGDYWNIVCGTGTTGGDAVLTPSVGAPGGGVRSDGQLKSGVNNDDEVDPPGTATIEGVAAAYEILFVAGQGVVVFDSELQADGRDGTGGGVVNIRPIPHPTTLGDDEIGCVNVPVTDFDVSGVFVGTVTE